MLDYISIQDQKAPATDGGGFTSGAWRTRDLTTEVSDIGGHATLAANQVTLVAGTYVARIKAPAYNVNLHYTRLRNITDGTTTLLGSNEYQNVSNPSSGNSWIMGIFTIGGTKTFEVQHWCQTTRATDGFGRNCNLDGARVELYTIADFIRIA